MKILKQEKWQYKEQIFQFSENPRTILRMSEILSIARSMFLQPRFPRKGILSSSLYYQHINHTRNTKLFSQFSRFPELPLGTWLVGTYCTWSHSYSSTPSHSLPPPVVCTGIHRATYVRWCRDITVNIASCPPVIRLFRNQPGPTLCMLHVASHGNTCASSFVIATRNVITDAILTQEQ